MDNFGKNIPFHSFIRVPLTVPVPLVPWWDRVCEMDEPWGDAGDARFMSLQNKLFTDIERCLLTFPQ